MIAKSRAEILQALVAQSRPIKIGPLQLFLKIFYEIKQHRAIRNCEHINPFFEIDIVKQGTVQFLIDGEKTVSSEGRKIFFIPPTVPHMRKIDEEDNHTLVIHFSCEAANENGRRVIAQLYERLKQYSYCFEWHSDFEEIIEAWIAIIDKREVLWQELAENKLKEFILLFFKYNFPDILEQDNSLVSIGKKDLFVKNILHNLDRFLNQRMTVQDYADMAGISTRHVSRLIKEETGMSIVKYVQSRRIEIARHMLEADTMFVKDVAAALDFKDQSYFCRIFKKYTGLTPSEFCKSQKKRKVKKHSGG